MNENKNGIIVSDKVVEMVPLSCNTVLNDIEENGLECGIIVSQMNFLYLK